MKNVNQICHFLIVGTTLLFNACSRTDSGAGSREDDTIVNLPVQIDSSVLRRGRVLVDRIRDACTQISALSNREERVACLYKMSEAIDSIDFSEYDFSELSGMPQNLILSYEQLAYHLVENGVSEQMVGDFILSGFSKYRKMCFSFGDEKDFSDGNDSPARERRRMARGMRLAWLNDAGFFEQHSIRTIFSGKPEAGHRFTERWHRVFGCHDERVKRLLNEKCQNHASRGEKMP